MNLGRGEGGAEVVLRGERRHATVLLADVVNSTELLETLGSEAWVEMMNRVFQIAGSEIYRYGGEIDQFRGDGLVAFFGAGTAHENDPERAVLAALRMQSAVEAYAQDVARSYGIELRLRVGINTGEVIVTQVGDRARHFEQTAMGAAVALAARMESAAEPGTVLVSAHTYRLLTDAFVWQPLGEITVKGVRHPVSVYRPLRPKPREATSRRGRESLAGLDSPLVGRQREFRTLQRAVQAVREGQGGVVTVVGEAGIGKSRLVAEVRLRAERTLAPNPLLWVEGRCHAMGAGTAFLPWTTMLRRLLGLGTLDLPEPGEEAVAGRLQDRELSSDGRALLRRRLAALGIGERSEGEGRDARSGEPETVSDRARERALEREVVARALARVLTLDGDAEVGTPLRSSAAPIAHAVRSVIAAVARRHPLILVFEDLHWADVASLQLLQQVVSVVRRVPLLVICVTRPAVESPPQTAAALEELHATVAREGVHHTELRLASLPPARVAELVANLLASTPAEHVQVTPTSGTAATVEAGGPSGAQSSQDDVSLSKAILVASGGNPYFVEELVRSLIDRGDLLCDAATCRRQPPRTEGFDIPDTLRSVLTARMDRLPPETRCCLQVAAVIGRIFPRDLLAEILSDSNAGCGDRQVGKLDEHLATLVDAQMIRRQDDKAGEQYIFKHQLMQDAAYHSLLRGERRRIHRHLAEALQDVTPATGALASLVAHHWLAAGEVRQAIPHLLRAAGHARQVYAYDTARTLYKQVLDHLDDLSTAAASDTTLLRWRLEALRGAGQVAFSVGHLDKAEAALRGAIAAGRRLDLPTKALIRLYHWLGEVLFWQDRFAERVALGKEGLALLDPEAQTVEVALMNQMVAIGLLTQGDQAGYFDYTRRTESFIRTLPYVPELMPAYEHIISAHLWRNEVAAALEMLSFFRSQVDLDRDLAAAAAVHRQDAEICLAVGDLEGGLAAHRIALSLFRRLGDTKHAIWSLGDVGWLELQMGNLDEAAQYLEEMTRLGPTLSHYMDTAYTLQGRLFLGLQMGDLAGAREAGRTLVTQMTDAGFPYRIGWAHYLMAQVHLAAGDREAAGESLRAALDQVSGERTTHVPLAVVALAGLAAAESIAAADELAAEKLPTVPWGLRPASPTQLAGDSLRPGNSKPAVLAHGWEWRDPLGGCRYRVDGDLVIYTIVGRDFAASNLSAPRVWRPVAGDVAVSARVGQASPELPHAAGVVFYWDSANYLHVTVGAVLTEPVVFGGALDNGSVIEGAAALRRLPGERGVALRLERVGGTVRALLSFDDDTWFSLGQIAGPNTDPVWAGVMALGDLDRTIRQGIIPAGTAARFRDVVVQLAAH